MDVVFASLKFCLLFHCVIGDKITDLDIAKDFLTDFNEKAMDLYYWSTEAAWAFNTNLTEENQRKQVRVNWVPLTKSSTTTRTRLQPQISLYQNYLVQCKKGW